MRTLLIPHTHTHKRITRKYHKQLHANKLDNIDETGKFLETQNLSRLKHIEMENLNRHFTSMVIKSVIKVFQQQQEQQKTLDLWSLLVSPIKYFKMNTNTFQTFPKKLKSWGPTLTCEHSLSSGSVLLCYQRQVKNL